MGIIKKIDKVFLISLILAIISCFFVPISKQYLSYFDFKTLITLFLMMTIIGGFRNIKLFEILSDRIVRRFENTKVIIIFLVMITFVGDMILANDMSLITFIPLTFAIFKGTKQERYVIFTVIMQVIAADLGGMITPFGNPQNLYAYSRYNLMPIEFFEIMIIPFSIALVLLVIIISCIPKEKMILEKPKETKIDKIRSTIYIVLFISVVLMIFRIIPIWIEFLIIMPIMLITDKKAFLKVDYILLLTFSMFFIFSGNIARLDVVNSFITNFFVGNELEVGIGICQFMSNVPTTILLSNFTQNYSALLIAVNIGSLGTLVASMASLIAYRMFTAEFKNKSMKYLKIFTITNVVFLIVLYVCMKILHLG